MKSPRVLIALSLLLLDLGWLIWNHVHTFSPTLETESAFFKNYTPTNALNRFNDGQASYTSGRGGVAGYDSVTHTADFHGDFALCSENFMPLMDALKDDVAAQLLRNDAQIVSRIGEASAGFHFDYKLGKIVGSVTISPLELPPHVSGTFSRSMPHPKCMVEVRTSIAVTEKWFPKDPGLIQVSANNSIRPHPQFPSSITLTVFSNLRRD